MLRDLEIELNTHMLRANCNKNIAAQTVKDFHGASGDTQVRQESTKSLLCTGLFWTAELGLGIT